jgi:hypothetical protein
MKYFQTDILIDLSFWKINKEKVGKNIFIDRIQSSKLGLND